MKTDKPLTILFDANPLAQSGKSGVGHYTFRLVQALADTYPQDLKLIGHYYDFLRRKKGLDLPHADNIYYRRTILLPGKVFSVLRRKLRIAMPLEVLTRCRADVLLFPNFVISPSLFSKPRVVTIHDLYFTEHPEHIQPKNLSFLRQFVPSAVRDSAAILAVSQFTREAIVQKYQVPAEKIVVTPIPLTESMPCPPSDATSVVRDMGIEKNYLLFIGNLEPRKNIVRLVDAYRQLPGDLRASHSLILAGGKGWNDEEIQEAIAKGKQDGLDIRTPGYISEQQKKALYTNAEAVVLPSLYEGFGMQLLEAMSAQTPVVASDIGVFHEVAGDACLYVNPLDSRDIARGITRILTDHKLHAKLIQKGEQRLTIYAWRNIAENVYDKIRELTYDKKDSH